jgi:hypothetical protein
VAKVRQYASLDAGQTAEGLVHLGRDERIGTPVNHESWDVEPVELLAGPLHGGEERGAQVGRGAGIHKRIGEIGDPDVGVTGKLIARDRVGEDHGRRHGPENGGREGAATRARWLRAAAR